MKKGLDFLIITETWLRESDTLNDDSIVADLRHHTTTKAWTRGHFGIALVRNKQTTSLGDFKIIDMDEIDQSYIWFSFKNCLFGGFYLPPSMTEAKVQSKLETVSQRISAFNSDDAIILGDFNIRLGDRTGDHSTTTNRAHLIELLDNANLTLETPDEGKWTFLRPNMSSIIDYIFTSASMNARKMDITVHEDEIIGTTDHRLVTYKARLSEDDDNSNRKPSRKAWKLRLLEDPAIHKVYCETGAIQLQSTSRKMEEILESISTAGLIVPQG